MFLKTKPSLGLTVKNNDTVCKSKLKIVQCYEAGETDLRSRIVMYDQTFRTFGNTSLKTRRLCVLRVSLAQTFKHNIKHKCDQNKKEKKFGVVINMVLIKKTSSTTLYVVPYTFTGYT